MKQSSRSVSVILAGYNEAGTITYAMQEMYKALYEHFETFELILVDDGSTDDTLAKMMAFSDKHSKARVLPNYVNLNFGTSVLRGLYAARYEWITFNACDLPILPTDLVRAIDAMDETLDLLVLERKNYKTTVWRGITSSTNMLFLHFLFPRLIKGTPVLNFSQVYRKRIIKKIIPLARSPIFVWPELIFRVKLAKAYRWDNIPIKCNVVNLRRGAFGHPHDIIWGIYDMIRFRIKLWQKKI